MVPNKYSILVADDEYSNAETVLAMMGDDVERVLYAPNGKIAFELALEELPDIILMDWEMPEMTGIQAIDALKKNEKTKDIPVIISTGVKTDSINLKEALEVGAVDFIKKPFNKTEFLARTNSAIRIKRQHEQIKELLLNEKRLIETALEEKQRKLASMAMLESQKSSLLYDLLEQINRLDRITNHVYATDIKKIQSELKFQLDVDKSWNEFKLHFEDTHPGFFHKLDSQFSDLSVKDRRLCAYIKMGLGNYEICQLTSTSDAALKKAINRLKKKLNLSAGDDVRKFMYDF